MKPAYLVLTAATLVASAGVVVTATAPASNLLSATAAMPVAATATTSPGNIVQVADAAGSFKTLLAAAQAAGLADALATTDNLTVFAPTDEAFAALGKDAIADLLKPENKAKLAAILAYHVVPMKVEAAAAMKLAAADTLNGQRLALKVTSGSLFIDGAKVIKADVNASNGVIHVIDKVIMPETKNLAQLAMGTKDLSTLVTAVKAAGLADALMGSDALTVLAPTNAAFEKLPKDALAALLKPENKAVLADVIKYHVIAGRVFSDQALAKGDAATLQGQTVAFRAEGSQAMVNNAKIIATDIDAANGVVHVIDTVLIPEGVLKRLTSGAPAQQPNPEMLLAATPQRELIETAINLGAPMFNRGEAAGCAATYQVTALALAGDPRVPHDIRRGLRSTLATAAGQHDMEARAWTLRRGLDAALDAMPMGTASR